MNKAILVLSGLLATVLAIDSYTVTPVVVAQQSPLANQVLVIFEKKCAKCHGPKEMKTTTKPNGDFETIMDLPIIIANRDILVPGDLNESKLWTMVEDDIMPDAEQDEEPLPANEKEIIRRWILAGTPVE